MRQSSGAPRPESKSASRPALSPEQARRIWPHALHVERLAFHRSPLLAAAVCFALGDTVRRFTIPTTRPTSLLLITCTALAALTLLALRRTPRLAIAPVAALWFAAGLWAAQIEPTTPTQTALLTYADGLSRTVQARVVRIRELPAHPDPNNNADSDFDQWEESGSPTLSIDLSLDSIEDLTPDLSRMASIHGGVRATIYAAPGTPLPPLHCGDRIEAPLRMRIPERYRDPGAWQYADYLLDQGIAANASLPAAKLHILPGTNAFALRCRIFAAQTWASARLLAYARSTPNRRLPTALRLTPDDIGMLNAMLFGDRTRLTHALRSGFERTGSFHLFVVSGMHVALLAGLLLWLTHRLHLRESIATPLTLALTASYAVLTGFGVPVQRALLMSAVFLCARLLSRRPIPLNALGAAALTVLLWSPRALFEASFQMTFLALVAVAGIAVPLGERTFTPYLSATRGLRYRWKDQALPPHLAQLRVMLRHWQRALNKAFAPPLGSLPAWTLHATLWAAELALIGLIAEAVMVLPMALYFHRATVFALAANIVSIPLVAILAPLGLITFCASLLNPWLAALPGAATALLLHVITFTIAHISRVRAADLRIDGPRLIPALLAVACFALCCWTVRRSRALSLVAVPTLILAVALVLLPTHPDLNPDTLEVTAIDVGQGDSLLIASPNGHTMLLDAGGPTGAAANAENATTSTAFDIGEEVVSPYLWSRHLRSLDVVALTHAHSDHMGGMAAVLRNFHPRELWVSLDTHEPAYLALLAEAASLNIRVRHLRAGDTLPWDGVTVTALAPQPAYANLGPPTNNDSLVLRLQFGASSVLLEGDAEAASERAMVSSSFSGTGPKLGHVTLLKVGHHGSRTSTTPELLSLASPTDAIISVGRANTFGHPNSEIIERLAEAHTHVFRTDEFGLTTFLLSRDGRITALTPASNP